LKVCFKNIFPVLLLWLFLYPTSVQLHHHHDEAVDFHACDGTSMHELHEACAVCEFHFTLFSDQPPITVSAPILLTFEKLVINYSAPFITSCLQVASVRGPPVFS
jgi:hypothetical protein